MKLYKTNYKEENIDLDINNIKNYFKIDNSNTISDTYINEELEEDGED